MEKEAQQIPAMTVDEFKILLKSIVYEVVQEINSPAIQMLNDFLNAREAAKFLNMAMQTLYEKTSQKIIPHYKQGNKIIFKRSELAKWMEAGKVSTLADLELKAYESSRLAKERRAFRSRNALRKTN